MPRKECSGILLSCVCGFVLATVPAYSQQTSGAITGTVVDTQGSVVPGAKVTLVDQLQNSIRRSVSGSEGGFTFSPILPSTYSLSVEAAGFKRLEKRDIILHANDRLEVPGIQLELGAVSETVTVEANAVVLQTQSAEKASVLTGEQVAELPIYDRNFMALLVTVPGAVNVNNFNANVNGNRNDQMSFKVDGINNMDSGVNMCCATWVNVDSIAEFKVITNSQTADIGHSGGASVSVVTKSGTRSLRGTLFGYFKNDSMNANSWQNNANGVSRPVQRFSNIGYEVGGPVLLPFTQFNRKRDKLFFHASLERMRQFNPSNLQTNTVPTADERAGNFSASHDTGGRVYTIVDPLNERAPFPGNIIPRDRFNPDGAKLLNFFPLPNFCCDNGYNFTSAKSNENPRNLQGYKFDYNITEKWRAGFRYNRDYQTTIGPYGVSNILGIGENYTNRPSFGFIANLNTVISPTSTNEFIFGGSQNFYKNNLRNNTYLRSSLGLSYRSPYPDAILNDMGPQITFGGSVPNAPSLGSNRPTIFNNVNFNITDNYAKVFNKHNLRIGVAIERDRKDQTNGNPVGNISVSQDNNNPLDSGYAFSNLLLGNFNTFTQADRQRLGQYRFTNLEWYIADTWRVNKKLTLDLGIRFYIMQPIYDARMQISTFNPALYKPERAVQLYQRQRNPANNQVMAYNPLNGTYLPSTLIGFIIPGSGDPNNGFIRAGTDGYPRGLIDSQGVLYGPRFGLAYKFTEKTVFRVGAGVFYDRIQANVTYDSLNLPPTTRTGTIYYGNLATVASLGENFGPPNCSCGFDRKGEVPTVYNYNLSIQREMPFKLMTEFSYVGNVGRHLLIRPPYNAVPFGSAWLPENQDPTVTPRFDGTTTLPANFYRPYRGIGNLSMVNAGGTTSYNGLQVSARRSMRNRLSFGANYTFSKALGSADSIYTGLHPFNIRQANYGRINYDATHVFSANYIYQLPKITRTKVLDNRVGRAVIDGWQFTGIVAMQTGFPTQLGYSIPGVNLSNTVTGQPDVGPRPILTGDPNMAHSDRSIYAWFNTNTLRPAAKGSTGLDSGLRYLTGPGVNNWDMTMQKQFTFSTEPRRYLTLRLETFNTFNHTQFSGINTNAQFDATGTTITNLPMAVGGGGGRLGFGSVSGVRNARRVQVALRLSF